MKMGLTTTLTAATLLVATTVARTASAEPAPTVDWARVLGDLDLVARAGADVVDRPRCSLAGCQTDTNATAAPPERIATQEQARATVSLVARDWSSAYKVAGDRLALLDALRLTSSTRMVLARVRLSDPRISPRISPFAQVGLGHWRTDPYLLPLTARYTEVAAQAAGGVELRVIGTWRVALESTVTVLYRETRDQNVPAARNWSSTFATSIDF